MGLTATDVVTFAYNRVVMHNDGTYHWIGSGIASPVFSQLDASGYIFFVFCHHGSFLIPIFAFKNRMLCIP
jgi:hypothetical protein